MKTQKIYIFGDSFAMDCPESYCWVNLLRNDFLVKNFAYGGNNNHNIYLEFIQNFECIEPDDFIILGWTFFNRPYLNKNLHWRKNLKKIELYHKYFFDRNLEEERLKLYMDKVKSLLTCHSRHLIFRSFPDYFYNNAHWTQNTNDIYDFNNYGYYVQFDNQLLPPLVHFSMAELDKDKSSKYYLEKFYNDQRPNHIKSEILHRKIYHTVKEYINGKQGTLYLENID